MGICSSCLGQRRPSRSDPSESSALLNEQYANNYGSATPNGPHRAPEPDPEEIRRQRDALERICAQTSDKLIDVSAPHTTAQDPSHPTSTMAEYPRLFLERFPPPTFQNEPPASRPTSAPGSTMGEEDVDEQTWLHNVVGNDADDEGPWNKVRANGVGSLTIQFEDSLKVK